MLNAQGSSDLVDLALLPTQPRHTSGLAAFHSSGTNSMLISLRTRLIAICVSIVVFGMSVLALGNFLTTRHHMLLTVDSQMHQLSQSHAGTIAEWMSSKQAIVASLTDAASSPDPMPFLKAAERAGQFDLAYLGYPDKRAVFSQERTRKADYDPTARPWYIKASEAGGPIITAPYIGASSGKLLITFAQPVGVKGAPSAVAAADVLLDTVVSNVVAIKPTANSFAFLIDGKGTVIAHPDKKFTLKSISDLDSSLSPRTLLRTEQSGHSEAVQIGGKAVMLYGAQVPGTDWILAIALDRSEATETLTAMLQTSAVIAVVVLGLAACVLTLLIAAMLKRLALAREAMSEIASGEGDLTRRLDVTGLDELAQIAIAFNSFTDKISKALLEIRGASVSVKTAAQEIAAGNMDLSSRTETQASSLEETASSMEELTSTVKQNADNARQASALAVSASSIALRGGTVVTQVMETMDSIRQSSKKISEIIGIIDGIAFQTNILALNAAVEAARAGEQGRGFAVVASEVRTLAQRSASAAKDIKELIDESVSKVAVGSELAGEAGSTMKDIVAGVKSVSDIMAEIAAASSEQSAGIDQVNQAIGQMDQVTQQNAALVEEAAAAAGSLQAQADQLAQAVALFKLDNNDRTALVRPELPLLLDREG